MKDLIPLAFKKLVNALEEIEKQYKIQYYLVGGLLVNVYSVFRITQDIDFVVDVCFYLPKLHLHTVNFF